MVAPQSSAPEWAGYAPGVELGAALEDVDVLALEDSPVVDVIVSVERQIAHLRAIQMNAMVELSRRENYAFCGGCDDDALEASTQHLHHPVRAVGSEVSAALHCTPRQADTRVALAVELAEDLPATLAALEAGVIDEQRAGLIASKTRLLDPHAQGLVEEHVLPTAGERTTSQLARMLDRQVMRADPGAAERRRHKGRAERRVEKPRPVGGADGVAEMVLTGPGEDLAALYTAVDAAARAARSAGDPRTLDQLRFDIATGLGWTGLDIGHLGCCAPDCAPAAPATGSAAGAAAQTATGPEAGSVAGAAAGSRAGSATGVHRVGAQHGRAATVNVTIAFSTLIGVNDEPAHLDGYGPITAETGRMIAADATLRRLLTDPADGQLLEYGRTTYTPPQALADYVIARDRTCRFPTADTPARHSDIDHRVPFDQGGTTGASNNEALSRRFHLDKTLHGWHLEQPSPGVHLWTSPAGRTYRVAPEIIGLIHDPPPRQPRTNDEVPDF